MSSAKWHPFCLVPQCVKSHRLPLPPPQTKKKRKTNPILYFLSNGQLTMFLSRTKFKFLIVNMELWATSLSYAQFMNWHTSMFVLFLNQTCGKEEQFGIGRKWYRVAWTTFWHETNSLQSRSCWLTECLPTCHIKRRLRGSGSFILSVSE